MMKNNTTITLRLPAWQVEILRQIAERQEMSISALVRDAIEKYLKSYDRRK